MACYGHKCKMSALRKGALSLLTTTIIGECHYPYFIDVHREVKGSSDLTKVTGLANEAGFKLGFV